MVEIFAYAKINLYLDIQKKREDGYHDIVSVMQSIDWSDKIHISKTEEPGIFLTCTEPRIPVDERNTAYKAAKRFLQQISYCGGISIHIEKNIPHEAGMAGGSADAASTLKGLNQLFGEPLPLETLLALGKTIGADVPFCILGGTRLVTGIGEITEPFCTMPDCYLVCAKPGEGISTPAAYAELDKKHADFKSYVGHRQRLDALRDAFESQSLSNIPCGLYNVFEEVISQRCPAVDSIKESLLKHGAIGALMSGSGPSVFGIFDSREQAEKACLALAPLDVICRVCKPV